MLFTTGVLVQPTLDIADDEKRAAHRADLHGLLHLGIGLFFC